MSEVIQLKATREKLDRARARFGAKMDRMFNFATGLGGPNDKGRANAWYYDYPNPYILDAMHQSDTVVARIVETLPRDAFAKGFDVSSPADIPYRTDVQGDALNDWVKRKRVIQHFKYAAGLARLYGGAGIVLHVDDGRPADQPVDMDNIKSVTLTKARDRWELFPIQWFTDFGDPRYEEPSVYNLTPRSYGGATTGYSHRIHADRLLRFDGFELSPDAWARNLYWGGSVVWRAKDRIERFVNGELSMSTLLQEAKEDVLFLEQYRELESDPIGKELINDRATDIATVRGMLGMTILDAKDKYETRMRPLNGVGDIYDRALLSVAQAAEMPVTLLFGDAARGLSADDKAGRTYYSASIKATQQDRINPALEHLLLLAFASEDGPTAGVRAEGWEILWPPYEEETELERSQRQKTEAEADTLNIAAGIYTAEDVRRARYAPGATGIIVVEDRPEVTPEVVGEAVEATEQRQEDKSKEALNGAQISSLMEIAIAVNAGQISSDAGRALVMAGFPGIDTTTASAIVGFEVGDPSRPEVKAPAAAAATTDIAARPEQQSNPGLPPGEAWPTLHESTTKVDADVTDFPEEGDDKKVSLRNSQHGLFDVAFAKDLKENWPSIWRLGGNIKGAEQFRKLVPIAERGGNTTSEMEENAVRLREAWGSRHLKDFQPAGVVAQIKWLVVGSRGEDHMKKVIAELKKKERAKEDGTMDLGRVAVGIELGREDREKQDERTKAQTPAEPDERVKGSDTNPEGSASTTRGGIEITEEVEKALKQKAEAHNEEHDAPGKRADVGTLKAVWRRAAGAFSTSHRPTDRRKRTITRAQWAMARVNRFLELLAKGKPHKRGYTQDNDLLPEEHPRHSPNEKADAELDEDLARVAGRIDAAEEELIERLAALSTDLRDDFDSIVNDNETPEDLADDLDLLRAEYQPRFRDAAREEMLQVAQLAADDLADQNDTEVPEVELSAEQVLQANSIADETLNRTLGQMRDVQVRRMARDGGAPDVTPVLALATLALIATKATTRGVALGRDAVMQQIVETRPMMARRDATLDANTCGPCTDLDGLEAEVGSDDYYTYMPPNGCDGGSRCRCVWRYFEPSADTSGKQDEDEAKMDPYDGPDDSSLPDHVKKLGVDARRKWVSTWMSVYEKTSDEGEAFKVANAGINKE